MDISNENLKLIIFGLILGCFCIFFLTELIFIKFIPRVQLELSQKMSKNLNKELKIRFNYVPAYHYMVGFEEKKITRFSVSRLKNKKDFYETLSVRSDRKILTKTFEKFDFLNRINSGYEELLFRELDRRQDYFIEIQVNDLLEKYNWFDLDEVYIGILNGSFGKEKVDVLNLMLLPTISFRITSQLIEMVRNSKNITELQEELTKRRKELLLTDNDILQVLAYYVEKNNQ